MSVYFWKITILKHANICVKPEICMCQMTHKTIISCGILQNNASMARKTQPWQNTEHIRELLLDISTSAEVHKNGDNHMQNVRFRRYMCGYTVGNHI